MIRKVSVVLISCFAVILSGCIIVCSENCPHNGLVIKSSSSSSSLVSSKKIDYVTKENTFELSEACASGLTLKCEIPNSKITLKGGTEEVCKATGKYRVIADGGERAAKLLEATKVSIKVSATEIVVSLDCSDKQENESIGANIELQVPTKTNVNLTTAYETIGVTGINGKVTIGNNRGSVEVADVNGDLVVNNSFGRVKATNVQGSAISLKSSYDSIFVENCSGILTVNNERGSVTVNKYNCRANANDAPGMLSINSSFGKIDLKEVQAGEMRAKTSYDSMIISQCSGLLQVKNERGSIIINDQNCRKSADEPAGELIAGSSFGRIEIKGVKTSAMNVSSSYDAIKIDNCSGELSVKNERGSIIVTNFPMTITGETIAEPAAVKLNSSFGKLELEKVRTGNFDLKTSYDSISVKDCSGNITANNERGSVKVESLTCASAQIKTSFGAINFSGIGTKPDFKGNFEASYDHINISDIPNFAGSIDLDCQQGQINSALPIAIEVMGNISKEHITGKVGTGTGELKVKNSRGNINLK